MYDFQGMSAIDHQLVIDELDALIDDVLTMIERFQAHELEDALADDYARLFVILERARDQRREHDEALKRKRLH
jgi:hypothetical protein